ncbi:hypothetical protein KIN20_033598 [Parelaphostrongylus tenuis]|uniref:Uncharacterized protein n=1 Tax=Parelaphostrongylus tenuis TaxID=148309 RepID=A0AAD5R8L7_PARTN|nr:hypothetical protein KIN20_033598 [Parelaphostrongylus tenuis]
MEVLLGVARINRRLTGRQVIQAGVEKRFINLIKQPKTLIGLRDTERDCTHNSKRSAQQCENPSKIY